MSYREEIHSWEVLHKVEQSDDPRELLIVRGDFSEEVFIIVRPREDACDWIHLDPDTAEKIGRSLIELAEMARAMQ